MGGMDGLVLWRFPMFNVPLEESLQSYKESSTNDLVQESYDRDSIKSFEASKLNYEQPNLTNVLPAVSFFDSEWGSELLRSIAKFSDKGPHTPTVPALTEQPQTATGGDTSKAGSQEERMRREREGKQPDGQYYPPGDERELPPRLRYNKQAQPQEDPQADKNVQAKPADLPAQHNPNNRPANLEEPGTPRYYERVLQTGGAEEKLLAAAHHGDGEHSVMLGPDKSIPVYVDVNPTGNEGTYYVNIYAYDENGKPYIAYRGIYDENTGKMSRQVDENGNPVPYVSDRFVEEHGNDLTERDKAGH